MKKFAIETMGKHPISGKVLKVRYGWSSLDDPYGAFKPGYFISAWFDQVEASTIYFLQEGDDWGISELKIRYLLRVWQVKDNIFKRIFSQNS